MKIVIIGAGISGLAAAHYLHVSTTALRDSNQDLSESTNTLGQPVEISILEATDHAGGVINSLTMPELLLELGPDSFITNKPGAINLCKQLGLEEQIIGTNDKNRRVFIAKGGKLLSLPEGFMMMAPSQWSSFLASPLFSIGGKLRMALETLIPAKTENGDESLSSFVTRRLGKEALDLVAQPMIGGIYTANPDTLSLRATMPRFLDLEKKHGSIIRGLMLDSTQKQKTDTGARYSMFASLKNGMSSLTEAIIAALPKGTISFGNAVKSLERKNNQWLVTTNKGVEIICDNLILATPSYVSGSLLSHVDPALSQDLASIEYASSAVINLVFQRSQIAHKLDGFGFVVPAIEKRSIIAGSFSSIKFSGRAPANQVIVRLFVGGAMYPEILDWTDSAIIEQALSELNIYIGITGEPINTTLTRYPRSMPQYKVGHLDLAARIFDSASQIPGLFLAGNAYAGVGIPDCITNAQSAAQALLKRYSQKTN